MVDEQKPKREIRAQRDYRRNDFGDRAIYAERDIHFHPETDSKPLPEKPPRSVPFRGVTNFVGREGELERLHQVLRENPRAAISAIAGMGGVGKTELAIQYLERYQNEYPGGICWLTGRDGNLAEQVLQFANLQLGLEVPQRIGERRLEIPEQVRWCWHSWRPPEGLVLLVVDDATDVRRCREVLPTERRFRVLITTRLRRLDPEFVVEMPLDVLPRGASLQLLAALLGARDSRIQKDSPAADQLCAWLGDLPLGLRLVGRYLAEDPDLSVGEMLERLRERSLDEEAMELEEGRSQQVLSQQARRGLKAAFELSWQELDKTARRVAPVLSLFAPKPSVWRWDWVEDVVESVGVERGDVSKVRKQLYKRHFVERVEEGYTVHPLMREFLRGKLEACEGAEKFKKVFAKACADTARKIPQDLTLQQIEEVQIAIPHLRVVAQNLINALSNDDLIEPFIGLGRFYKSQGSYALAEPWYDQCVAVAKERFGQEHPHTATSLNNLAELYKSQGRYEEAEPLHLEALEERKKLLRGEHPHTATSLNNLAELYKSQGRYLEAEPLYLQALEITKNLLLGENPYTAVLLNNLGELYRIQGRYSEAKPLYLQALEIAKKLLGPEHPYIATSLNNLANLYEHQGRYSEAESLHLEVLKIRKKLLGPKHPSMVTSLNNLANLYRSQRRYSEAEPLYLEALHMMRRLLGQEHPDTATILNNLAGLYESQGRFEEVEPVYLEALHIANKFLGQEHPNTATILNNLAGLYYKQERYEEAEPLYEQALEVSDRLLGPTHPQTIKVRENLAKLQEEKGKKS